MHRRRSTRLAHRHSMLCRDACRNPLHLAHEFALRLHGALRPGTTAIVTDEPLQPRANGIDVVEPGDGRWAGRLRESDPRIH